MAGVGLILGLMTAAVPETWRISSERKVDWRRVASERIRPIDHREPLLLAPDAGIMNYMRTGRFSLMLFSDRESDQIISFRRNRPDYVYFYRPYQKEWGDVYRAIKAVLKQPPEEFSGIRIWAERGYELWAMDYPRIVLVDGVGAFQEDKSKEHVKVSQAGCVAPSATKESIVLCPSDSGSFVDKLIRFPRGVRASRLHAAAIVRSENDRDCRLNIYLTTNDENFSYSRSMVGEGNPKKAVHELVFPEDPLIKSVRVRIGIGKEVTHPVVIEQATAVLLR